MSIWMNCRTGLLRVASQEISHVFLKMFTTAFPNPNDHITPGSPRMMKLHPWLNVMFFFTWSHSDVFSKVTQTKCGCSTWLSGMPWHDRRTVHCFVKWEDKNISCQVEQEGRKYHLAIGSRFSNNFYLAWFFKKNGLHDYSKLYVMKYRYNHAHLLWHCLVNKKQQ